MFNKKYNLNSVIVKIKKKDYIKAKKIIKKYGPIYKKYILELKRKENKKFCLKREITNIERHKELVVNLLLNVASEFKIFEKLKVTIFLTGSFARNTNKINSDVDIHFLYSNIFKPFVWKYEELYFYIVSSILGIERNNLHSVITTKLSKRKTNYFNKLNDNKYLNVTLFCNEKEYFNYKFYSTTKKRFFLQYCNSKSFNAFNRYIKKEIRNENKEWAHNFLCILNNKFEKNYCKLLKYEKKHLNKEKLIQKITCYEEKILEKPINSNEIIDIKKFYQQKELSNIYNILNIFRNYIMLNGKETNYFNLKTIFNTDIFRKLESFDIIQKRIYHYLYLLKKLSDYCYENNIPYSIHKQSKINYDLSEIKSEYKLVNKELLKILNYMKGDLK